MTAMTAATLDTLSGGRFRLGLGVSGPQVSEGWHGVRFDKPLGRTREYVEIVRMALARETVRHEGEFWTLPLPDGPGKALRLTVHPVRDDIPLYLAAIGPKNLELTGEIADGWLAIFFAPGARRPSSWRTSSDGPGHGRQGPGRLRRRTHRAGRRRRRPRRRAPSRCATTPRCTSAAWAAGSRTSTTGWRSRWATRRRPREVQDLYLARKHRDAAEAVPFEFIDRTSLIGPRERIRDRLAAYAEAGVTTLSVASYAGGLDERVAALRTLAEALDESGPGGVAG